VEPHNVPGNPKPVNTFLARERSPSTCPAGILAERLEGTTLLTVPPHRAWPHCCVILDVATDPESVLMARIDFPPLTITVLQVDGLPPSV